MFEGEYKNGMKWIGILNDDHGHLLYEINNGKGYYREFNQLNRLIFQGEHLNGERNGKGKEYNDNGFMIFEGEYLNGKRNGKGKEYNKNDKIIFEGEYLNGKKWNGIGYDTINNIIYKINNGRIYSRI